MLTRRLATTLLAQLAAGATPTALATALGFHAGTVVLDDALAQALGVVPAGDTAPPPELLAGPGALRALVAVAPAHESLRPWLARTAARLTARAPHQLWLVVIAHARTREHVVAAWQHDGRRARISALCFDPARPLESDIETLVALSAAAGALDTLVHARWCEILGRDALSNRFYRALERAVVSLGEGARGNAPAEARRELALLTASRLLFLSFLQPRGWLDSDADFLVRHFERALEHGGGAHRHFLEPLFFGTLNTRPARRAAEARRFGRVPFLNGGLFARAPLEMRHRTLRFRDEELAALFDDVLTRYRFTGREEQRDFGEAAVDPEILGRAFESLMATRERRDSGAYYTPHALVARITDAALDAALAAHGVSEACRRAITTDAALAPADAAAVRAVVPHLRLLDPACGSGAFLVHLLERLATVLRLAGDERPVPELRRDILTRSIFGVDINPMAVWLCELRLWLSVVVEIDTGDPLAVTPLPNLDRNVRVGDALGGGTFTSTTGETSGPSTPCRGNIRTAPLVVLRARYARATGTRKASLARALDTAERRAAVAALDVQIGQGVAERRSLVCAARGRDLFGGRRGSLGGERRARETLRVQLRAWRAARRRLLDGGALPFRFASHFADVAADGGFDLVIGNPPWVRLHRIPAVRREALRAEFRVFRDAAWRDGAEQAGAGPGFAAQVDLAALFAERGVDLLRPGGTLALLLPVKLWRSLAGGGVRALLSEEHALRLLEDWSEAPVAFDAAVYPSLVVVQRRAAGDGRGFGGMPTPYSRESAGTSASDGLGSGGKSVSPGRGSAGMPAPDGQAALAKDMMLPGERSPEDGEAPETRRASRTPFVQTTAPAPGSDHRIRVALHRRDVAITWEVTRRELAVDGSRGAPWLLLPPDARTAFARVAECGVPLASSGLGRPLLGVKCGCNSAFVVTRLGGDRRESIVESDGRRGVVETSVLRPVLRGEGVRRWVAPPGDTHIVWTHGDDGDVRPVLPPLALRWLTRWRRELMARTDLRAGQAWWSLFRVEAATSHRPRVVWADVSRGPRACVVGSGAPWIPLNSCYVVVCRDDVDAAAFAALLNSPLAASWLDAVAEPARGGFRRYMGWTVARLPIPVDWARAREILAPLGARGVAGDTVTDDELLEGAIAAYRIRRAAARALVEWTWR